MIIADSEEGISLSTFDTASNQLKLRGHDLGIKQTLFSNLISVPI